MVLTMLFNKLFRRDVIGSHDLTCLVGKRTITTWCLLIFLKTIFLEIRFFSLKKTYGKVWIRLWVLSTCQVMVLTMLFNKLFRRDVIGSHDLTCLVGKRTNYFPVLWKFNINLLQYLYISKSLVIPNLHNQ
jgi:hypothetical protein